MNETEDIVLDPHEVSLAFLRRKLETQTNQLEVLVDLCGRLVAGTRSHVGPIGEFRDGELLGTLPYGHIVRLAEALQAMSPHDEETTA